MTSTRFVRMFGVAMLVAAGCGSNNPAASGAKGGTTGSGTGGATTVGSGGTSASGNGGVTTVGNGGTSASGNGGTVGNGGSTASGNGGTTAAGTGGANGAGGTGGIKISIGNTQCSDGIDNDGDGKIDYDDPECIGPWDNDESSFATGIPGDNMDTCKQDCFFDGNSGAGDDGCNWQLKCDPSSVEPKCPYDQQYATQHASECSVSSSQSKTCIDTCRKWVPNGCDCFGCCVVPGAPTPIRLASTCTAANFGDPTKCPACTQVTQCANPCEHCEICIGKPTLPADCTTSTPDAGTGTDGPPPPPNNCGSDFVPCGPGTATPADGCGPNYGCVTGCCIPTIF